MPASPLYRQVPASGASLERPWQRCAVTPFALSAQTPWGSHRVPAPLRLLIFRFCKARFPQRRPGAFVESQRAPLCISCPGNSRTGFIMRQHMQPYVMA